MPLVLSLRAALVALAIALGVVVGVQPKVALVVVLGVVALAVAAWARSRVLAMLALVPIVTPGITIQALRLPVADVACAVVLVLALFHRRESGEKLPIEPLVLTAAVLGAVAVSALLDHPPAAAAMRRVAHIALFSLLVLAIGGGRVRPGDMARAVRLGMAVGLLSGMAGLAGVEIFDKYPHRLSGLFGDPNVAAFSAIALGLVALHFLDTSSSRAALLGMMATIVVLSQSRTGIAALFLAFAWLFFLHRMPRTLSAAVVIGAVVLALSAPASIRTFGPFQDRTQSDQLRSAITAQETQAVRQHYPTGEGPGTATVEISNGEQFYFHNSYFAMLSEFGLLVLIPYFLLLVPTALLLFGSRPRAPALEAALLGVLVAALSLGEVFFALQTALVIGAAWRHISVAHSDVTATPRHARAAVG
jgi:hypothetical protein